MTMPVPERMKGLGPCRERGAPRLSSRTISLHPLIFLLTLFALILSVMTQVFLRVSPLGASADCEPRFSFKKETFSAFFCTDRRVTFCCMLRLYVVRIDTNQWQFAIEGRGDFLKPHLVQFAWGYG